MPEYLNDAKQDAVKTVQNFEDEIIEAILESGEAGDDINNDYPNGDSYHHENHTDKSYTLREAVELIEALDDYEETDSGLWEGQDMKEALRTCAAYTYSGAVYFQFKELIEKINDEVLDLDLDDIDEKYLKEAKEKLASMRDVEPDTIDDDDDALEVDTDAALAEKKTAIKSMIEIECKNFTK